MTEQSVGARPGVWDMLFTLVFGRRSAPAPRPQPAPPQPAPAPEIETQSPTPEPAPSPELETQEPIPAPEPAPAPIETAPAPLDPLTPATPIEVAAATAFVQRLLDYCVNEWNFFQQGQLKERHEPAVSRIGAYWANVGMEGWDGNTPEPWSAAFISFAMKEAGDNGRFKKNAGHCVYINDAIRRCDEAGAPFHGKRIEQYAPQLGDLICRNRGDSRVTFDTAPATDWYKSHTDIVTAIKPGEVEMIGGNVSNSVGVSRLKLLPDGRLDPADAAAHAVFAIMKNNL